MRKPSVRIPASTSSVNALLALALLVSCLLGCNLGGSCNVKIWAEVPSPNGKLKAVVYDRTCASTLCQPDNIVAILPINDKVNEIDKPGIVFSTSCQTERFQARWNGDEELVITGSLPPNEISWPMRGLPYQGVRIRYEQTKQSS